MILHWLGPMFDPLLAGYWGSSELEDALEVVVGIIEADVAKVDGIKISLLDAGKEIALRERLPDGVQLYTGDDFNYPELIRRERQPRAARHLRRDRAGRGGGAARARRGRPRRYEPLLAPTVPLARQLFAAPTQTTRRGSSSSPTSTATRSTSGWSAGSRARAPSCTWPSCSCSPTAPGLLRDPELASRAHAARARARGGAVSSRLSLQPR